MANTGQGSISVSQKAPPAGGGPPSPPFALTSANSGLHVDAITGIIQLGSDLGAKPLLQDTDIEMAGHQFIINDGGNIQFAIQPFFDRYRFGDVDGVTNGMLIDIDDGGNGIQLGNNSGNGMLISLSNASSQIVLGNVFGNNNNSVFRIDDVNQNFQMYSDPALGATWFSIDGINHQFKFGDAGIFFNGDMLFIDDVNRLTQLGNIAGSLGSRTQLKIDDPAQTIEMGDPSGVVSGAVLALSTALPDGALIYGTTNGPFFRTDPGAGAYQWGDLSGNYNNTKLLMNDAIQNISIISGTVPVGFYMALDVGNDQFNFGDLTPTSNGSAMFIDNVGQLIQIVSGNPQNPFLQLDIGNARYQIGDIDKVGNNMLLDINDATRVITLGRETVSGSGNDMALTIDDAARNIFIGTLSNNSTFMFINEAAAAIRVFCLSGFGINQTPTANSPLAVHAVPAFANNAAALGGGLSIGETYRISIAGTSTLAIVE